MSKAETESETDAKAVVDSRIDRLYNKLLRYIGKKISTFVAFLFMLFTAGVIFGILIVLYFPMLAPLIIAVLAILGVVAYYNRIAATIMFVILLIIMLI